ncbi:MAG: hypothetical protein HRT72_09415 [Flavobacteriales bacterium]|nr:hypothetical protein [Flavobacteriales bacterium]
METKALGSISVESIKPTKRIVCKYSHFLSHWQHYAGEKASICGAFGCQNGEDLACGQLHDVG